MAYSQTLNRIVSNCGLNAIADTLGNQLNYLPYDLPYELLPNAYPGARQPNGLPLQPLTKMMQPLPNTIQTIPNALQPLPNVIQSLPNVLQSLPNVLQQGVAPAAVIQDDTVAINLANALQLLVVSNLLRNTLPQARDVVAPYPVEYITSPPLGFGGYNYVY